MLSKKLYRCSMPDQVEIESHISELLGNNRGKISNMN